MAAAKPSFQNRLDAQISDLEPGKIYLVGVAIFRTKSISNSASKYQLLLVKRSPHEESFPDVWEIPAGHVEPGETVRQCVKREAFEETGLIVREVLRELAEISWESRKSGRKNVQFNYAVTVEEPYDILLNPGEHTEWMWAEVDQIEGLLMTQEMKEVASAALAFFKNA